MQITSSNLKNMAVTLAVIAVGLGVALVGYSQSSPDKPPAPIPTGQRIDLNARTGAGDESTRVQENTDGQGNAGTPGKYGEREIVAQAGQLIKLTVELQKGENGIVVANPTNEAADADLTAFDTEGNQADWQTVVVYPGEKRLIRFESVFQDLPLPNLQTVELQLSVRQSIEMTAYARTLPITFYSQLDPRWGSNRLGTCTGTTISGAGCAITAIAMAGSARVSNLTPATLNTWLTNNAGYSGGCNVYWAKPPAIDGSAGWLFIGTGTVSNAATMKAAIDRGRYLVARSSRRASHYVAIFGYTNQGLNLTDFVYYDPGDSRVTLRKVGDNSWVGASSTVQIYQ